MVLDSSYRPFGERRWRQIVTLSPIRMDDVHIKIESGMGNSYLKTYFEGGLLCAEK
jgi:hypothetical protein